MHSIEAGSNNNMIRTRRALVSLSAEPQSEMDEVRTRSRAASTGTEQGAKAAPRPRLKPDHPVVPFVELGLQTWQHGGDGVEGDGGDGDAGSGSYRGCARTADSVVRLRSVRRRHGQGRTNGPRQPCNWEPLVWRSASNGSLFNSVKPAIVGASSSRNIQHILIM